MNKKTVYWNSEIPGQTTSEFLTLPIITLKEHLINLNKNKKNPDDKLMNGYLACPAAPLSLNNILVVRAGLDITIKFKENSIVYDTNKIKDSDKKSFLNDLVFLRSHKNRLISFNHNICIFSEEDQHAIQMQPFLDATEFSKNTGSVVAQFNISKWFRPIQTTFYCHKDEIKIKEGDALFYIVMPCEEKIDIREFSMVRSIRELMVANTNLKFFKEMRSLKYLYDFFTTRNLNKKILKEIKNNLV